MAAQLTEMIRSNGRARRLWLAFVLIQMASIILAAMLHAILRPWVDVGVAGFLLAQPALAVVISFHLGQPRWWLMINAVFLPLVVAALFLDVHPAVYLAAFVFLWAVFGRTDRNGVPLFLSGRKTLDALAKLLPEHQGLRVMDLGSGTGSVLSGLRRRCPGAYVVGVEQAWLPWLVSRLRLVGDHQAEVRRGDLWSASLSEADVVYAFLSPVPMSRLWQKAREEMRPGTLFVSNTFAVPGVQPDRIIDVDNHIGSRLFVWTIH